MSFSKAVTGAFVAVLLGYAGNASARYAQSDPIGLQGGVNTYSYVKANPLNFIDPFGRDIGTVNYGFVFPFIGGFDVGFVFNDGRGECDGLPDFGTFVTLKKNAGGLGRFKATRGLSYTVGGRSNFDGTDAEIEIGLGTVGGSLGDFNDDVPTSVSFDLGPQLGFGASLTQTFSFTVNDIVNFLLQKQNEARKPNSCECKR